MTKPLVGVVEQGLGHRPPRKGRESRSDTKSCRLRLWDPRSLRTRSLRPPEWTPGRLGRFETKGSPWGPSGCRRRESTLDPCVVTGGGSDWSHHYRLAGVRTVGVVGMKDGRAARTGLSDPLSTAGGSLPDRVWEGYGGEGVTEESPSPGTRCEVLPPGLRLVFKGVEGPRSRKILGCLPSCPDGGPSSRPTITERPGSLLGRPRRSLRS